MTCYRVDQKEEKPRVVCVFFLFNAKTVSATEKNVLFKRYFFLLLNFNRTPPADGIAFEKRLVDDASDRTPGALVEQPDVDGDAVEATRVESVLVRLVHVTVNVLVGGI